MAVKAKAEITLYKIISVDKVVRYYLLQSSTLAAPSKPADGAVIGSNWSKTEPSYTSGSTSTLYFVDQTVLSNGALKYSEVSKSSSYEAAKEAWNKANNAQKTANDAIVDTYQEYYLSASQTALSGGSWSTTAPTWVNGKYMWSRTVKVDGAGNKTYTPSQNGVCIAGAKGDTGASGKGIKSTAIAYQLSTSQTKAPTGTWLSSPPKTDIATPYLWTRTVITYTDNTTSTSYGVSSTLDSLMVGGRNLFKHSSLVGEQLVCDSVNGCNSIDTKKYEDIGYHIVTPNAGNFNNGILFVFKDFTTLGLKKGDTITFSIDVKGTSDEHNPFLKIWLPKDDPNAWWVGDQSDNSEFVPTNEFKRASVTFTIPNTYELSYIFFGVHGNIQSDLYIRNAKLEKGTVATDWTPAPEDLETRVSAAETAISNNAKEIKLKASQDEVTAISDNLKVLTKTSTEFKQTVEGWQLNWDKLISTDNAEVASHQDYITFDKGDIILGESSNDLKLKITNDSIQFKGTSNTEVTPDSDATAWITGKTFHISDGEIQNSLKFGDLYLTPTSDTSLAFGKIGAFGSIATFGDILRIGYYNARRITISKDELVMRSGDMFGTDNKFFQVKYTSTVNDNSYPYMILGNQITKKEGGRNSIAIGRSNANGGNAMAIGNSAIVNGANSIALGTEVQSDNDNQMVIGKYNVSGDYPLIIGNGSYSSDSSARSNALTVDWDGNIVAPKLTSPGDLKLGFKNGNAFKPYFTKGDTTTVTVYLQGRIITSGKEITFYMPFSRPIKGATGVSVSSVNGIAVSQNGKSLYGSSSYVKPNAYSASIIGDGHGVNIRATMPNTTNATNNATCAITASIKITFP